MINLESNIKISDSDIREELREIYNRVNFEIPTSMWDLNKGYEFRFDNSHIGSGISGVFYELNNNLGGKVLYTGTNKTGIFLEKPTIAFKKLRSEFIKYKIGLELNVRLPESSDFVLAKEIKTGAYVPMIVNRNLGNIEVDDSEMKDIERRLSRESFEIEVKKIMPYLRHSGRIDLTKLGRNMSKADFIKNRNLGSDVCYANSRWDAKNKKAYLIDTGRWKFKELNQCFSSQLH